MASTQKRLALMQLMRLDRPIGIYLLMWPTLWSLFLSSEGAPPFNTLLIFLAGVVVMRSAGCVINDYADRHVDGQVERTSQRPLATGTVSSREALILFGCLIVAALVLVLLLNWQTIALSVGALILAASYPFMKRYTHYPQVVLGAAYGWAIPMAAMAITETVPLWAWLLFLANVCWTIAYDTYYAMVDRDDDLKVGIKSTAIAFGRYDLLIITLLQLVMLCLLGWVFSINNLNHYAYLGLVGAFIGFAIILWKARGRDKTALFNGFLNNHYIGAIIWLGIVVGLL